MKNSGAPCFLESLFQILMVINPKNGFPKKNPSGSLNTPPNQSDYLGVSKNRGTPKWMVYNGKPYKNGWFGVPPF